MGRGLAIFGVVTVLGLILSMTISVHALTKNAADKNSDAYKAAQVFLGIGICGTLIWAVVSVATTRDESVGSLASKSARVASDW
jgi:ABC-type arginine/histidine transport system permease subunit